MDRLQFQYRALNAAGNVEGGIVFDRSERDAYAALAARGLYPITLRVRLRGATRRTRLPVRDLALGLRILSDLLEAGLPVTRALGTFESLAPKTWRLGIPSLRDAVKEGRTLAAALSETPIEIPALVIGIARAGEAGTGIGPAIRRAADAMESSASVRAALRAALIYPIVLAVAGAASIGVLIGVVLPRFARILADLGQTLPASTELVVKGSLAVRAALLPGSVIAAALAAGLHGWTHTVKGRAAWHAMLLRIPVIGTIRTAATTARVTSSLGTLLESGVPLPQALLYAAQASGDAAVERRIASARARVAAGQSLASALRATGGLTLVAVQLIDAGEQSSRVPAMLAHAAKLEQERADRLMQGLVRFLEPALILLFAGIVGFVAAALLQAIYSVRPTA